MRWDLHLWSGVWSLISAYGIGISQLHVVKVGSEASGVCVVLLLLCGGPVRGAAVSRCVCVQFCGASNFFLLRVFFGSAVFGLFTYRLVAADVELMRCNLGQAEFVPYGTYLLLLGYDCTSYL